MEDLFDAGTFSKDSPDLIEILKEMYNNTDFSSPSSIWDNWKEMIPGYEAMSYYYNNPEGNALEFADKLAEDVVPMYYGIKEGSFPLAALDAMTLHMGGTALKKANKAKKASSTRKMLEE